MKKSLPLALCVAILLTASPAGASVPILSLTVDHGEPITLDSASSSIFVANPDIADVQVLSPKRIMVFGKRTGETTFVASDANGKALAERTIIVSQDLSSLRQEIDAAIPGNSIKAASVPNGIVLTGTAKDPTSVADANKIAMRYMPSGGDIINRIEVVGSNQVMIRVRFAEVQRSINNTLGFDWQNLLGGRNFTVGLANGNGVNLIGTGTFNSGTANNTGLFPRANNSALSLPNDVLGVATKIGSFNIDGMIEALSQDGLLTVLAEPNLTAMSGETANFLAGGQFPIPIPQANGTISIQFQPYGISLGFTPTLLRGDRISLHVRPEVSELTTNGSIVLNNITIPALTTRKAETTVEVGSGESFAIAGLMDNSQTQTVDKFPLLGDMPILGDLFRSSNFQNGQTELVVIITPYVVKPTKTQLALPTDGLAPPSEADRLGDQRFSSSDPNARPISGDPISAPAASPVTPVTTSMDPAGIMPSTPSVPTRGGGQQSGRIKEEDPDDAKWDAAHSSNNLTFGAAAPAPSNVDGVQQPHAFAATPANTVPASGSSPMIIHSGDSSGNGGLLVE